MLPRGVRERIVLSEEERMKRAALWLGELTPPPAILELQLGCGDLNLMRLQAGLLEWPR